MATSSSGSAPGRLDPEVIYWHFVNGRADELFKYLDSIPGASRDLECRKIRKAAMELRHMGSLVVGEPVRVTKNRAERRYHLAEAASKDARGSRLYHPKAIGYTASIRARGLNSSSYSGRPTSTEMNQLDSSLCAGKMLTGKASGTVCNEMHAESNGKAPLSEMILQEDRNGLNVSAAGAALGEHAGIGIESAEQNVLDAEFDLHNRQAKLHRLEAKFETLLQRMRNGQDLSKEEKKGFVQELQALKSDITDTKNGCSACEQAVQEARVAYQREIIRAQMLHRIA